MTTAVVFDYGFGNVRSMVRALANLGVDTTLTSDYRQSLEADGLVVPGVGAFAACMEGLKKVDGDRVIYDRIRAGRPVLGVCVGEQIMFEHGLEHGAHVHYIWLAGYEKPDFITINRFRNRVKKEINEVFTQTVVLLSSKGFISLNVEYIDGTKIESKANKYTFVWRKTVERNRERLMKKIHVLLGQIDDVIAREKSSENNEEVGFTPAMLAEMA